MIRYLVLALLSIFVLTVVRMIAGTLMKGVSEMMRPDEPAAAGGRPPHGTSASGELKKDPVCGTYVPVSGSLSKIVNGQAAYFCSVECRDKYSAKL